MLVYRPGVFYTIKMDGCLDVWDYFYKQNDPTLQVGPSCPAALNQFPKLLAGLQTNACMLQKPVGQLRSMNPFCVDQCMCCSAPYDTAI